ncbi:MAG: hypothetical protein ACNI26_06690 [Terasakiella sp.]|uniref:hypothetical protein n=1 Tax=unclassified Terasakiella TaxID=2614952 RepID=UPI003B004331
MAKSPNEIELEEENARLRQALQQVEEAQFRIYTDKLQDAVIARFRRLTLPITIIIVTFGFFGYNSITSQIELSLISPQINQIIGEEVAKEVTRETQGYIRDRLHQAEMALRLKDNEHTQKERLIENQTWVIVGTSQELADVIAERENILRVLLSKEINHTKKYPNLEFIKWRKGNLASNTLRYSLVIGPFDNNSAAKNVKENAIDDGFRNDSYVRFIQSATVLPSNE